MLRTFARRCAGVAAATTLVSAGMLVATAPPADAAPTGCDSWVNYMHNAAFSRCTGGSGTHQAVVVCTGGDVVFGPRVSATRESWALCDRWGTPPNQWWVSSHSFWVYD